MKKVHLIIMSALGTLSAQAADPSAVMKGRIKDGMYEIRTYIDALAGARATAGGAPGTAMTLRSCFDSSEPDLDKLMGLKAAAEKDCVVSNMRTTPNRVSYTAECKGKMSMKVDSVMTFAGDDYVIEMTGVIGGKPWNQRMEHRYLGPCAAHKEQTLEEKMKGVLGTENLPLSPEVLKMMRDMEAAGQPKGRVR